MVTEKNDMVRINTRVSKVLNDWLDEQSRMTGVPKSTLVFLALEQYKQQKEVMGQMAGMGEILRKLELLEGKLEEQGFGVEE